MAAPTALLGLFAVVVLAVAAFIVHRQRVELRDLRDELARSRRNAEQDRVQAEDARRRLVHALDAIPQAVLITDADGRVIFRNQSAETFESARHSDALVEAAITDLVGSALAGHGEQRSIDLFGPPRRSLVIATTPLLDARAEQPVLRARWRWSTTSPSAAVSRPSAATSSPTSATSCAPRSARSACWPRRCWPRTTPASPTGWPSGS